MSTPDIFLSAGVPGPADKPYCLSADPLLIHSGVRSLCALVFGQKRIVWGGHPAITPMMWAACENLGIRYADSVHLYQTRFFGEMFPEENARFGNVTLVDAGPDRATSLATMRAAMMLHDFEAGVFIGGKDGVLDEFELFRSAHPNAAVAVLSSTGGAALMLGKKYPEMAAPLDDFIDYTGYLSGIINLTPPPPKRRPGARMGRKR